MDDDVRHEFAHGKNSTFRAGALIERGPDESASAGRRLTVRRECRFEHRSRSFLDPVAHFYP
jgi:hypothetical protein